MRQSRLLTIFLSIITAVFILSASIAVPILLRPFYYAHIGPLELEKATGLDRWQIVRAYDEIMDFCTGRTSVFSAGGLPWSPSGAAHFSDVRSLLLLDLCAALLSGLLLLGWRLLAPKVSVRPRPLAGRSPSFWGCTGLCSVLLAVGGLAALDFSRAFLLFHVLLFPCKKNWMFDPRTDGIITILPQEFFQNCAVLILGLVVTLCLWCILRDLLPRSSK